MAKHNGRTDTPRDAAGAGPLLTAQAIVRAASGKPLRGSEPITTRTLAEHAPSREDSAAALAAFRAAGFETGALGGISFSITAPKARFEQFFGVDLDVDERGVVALAGRKPPSGGLDLPLDHLPPELSGRLEAVAFSPPADLHGGEGSALF
jgi:hypothetical protein